MATDISAKEQQLFETAKSICVGLICKSCKQPINNPNLQIHICKAKSQVRFLLKCFGCGCDKGTIICHECKLKKPLCNSSHVINHINGENHQSLICSVCAKTFRKPLDVFEHVLGIHLSKFMPNSTTQTSSDEQAANEHSSDYVFNHYPLHDEELEFVDDEGDDAIPLIAPRNREAQNIDNVNSISSSIITHSLSEISSCMSQDVCQQLEDSYIPFDQNDYDPNDSSANSREVLEMDNNIEEAMREFQNLDDFTFKNAQIPHPADVQRWNQLKKRYSSILTAAEWKNPSDEELLVENYPKIPSNFENTLRNGTTFEFVVVDYLFNGISREQAGVFLKSLRNKFLSNNPEQICDLPVSMDEVDSILKKMDVPKPLEFQEFESKIYSVAEIIAIIGLNIQHYSHLHFDYSEPQDGRMSQFYETQHFQTFALEAKTKNCLPFPLILFFDDLKAYYKKGKKVGGQKLY